MGPHPLIGTKRSVVKLTTFGLEAKRSAA